MTSVALETGRSGLTARRFRKRDGVRASPRRTALRQRMVTPARARAASSRYPPSREHRTAAPPRHALAREPRRDGRREGAGHGRPAVPRAASRAWFKVPPPGGQQLPRAEPADPRREPPHGLPGGRLPERRRLLGARHGDVHDPRRHVHAALRVLQRQDRQADVERPAGAAARRALRGADGPAPRGHHERRPRRPARLRRGRLGRRDPLDPHAGAAGARSSASRRTSAARRCRWRRSSPSGPTSSTTTSRSSRGCTRSRAAARAGSARCACCATPRRWAATR